MWPSLICVGIYFLTFTEGQFDSYEINQIDLTPLHDAIIFNDIADIVNEFENNLNLQVKDKYLNIGSDSDENVDDLLSEYQRYLDKAHKQRMIYMEKSKGKNKVPLKYHENYKKMKTSMQNKYDDSIDHFNNMKLSQLSLTEPLNLFMSQNAKLSIDKTPEFIDRPQDYNGNKNVKALLNMFPTITNTNKPITSCYCKANQMPCKCDCKKCIVLVDSLPTINLNPSDNQNAFKDNISKTSKYTLHNKVNKINEDKLNIRIKIDVQLPKVLSELIHKYRNKDKSTEREGTHSKENTSSMTLPFQYINFPFPLDMLGHKKMYDKHDNHAVHKITIHKKKKSRSSNSNKKHTGKFNQNQPIHNHTEEYNKTSKNVSIEPHNKIEDTETQTIKPVDKMITISEINNAVTDLPLKYRNGSVETVDITKNVNNTEEAIKMENSIETDILGKENKTIKPIRLKREAPINTAPQNNTDMLSAVLPLKFNKPVENTKEVKKFNKTNTEMELLYWPTETKNVTLVKSKNITALIYERETKKAKLNMTQGKIRSNKTAMLEQAIFGDVDWNDVDTVAPVFMSFVGKYIKGVLTFCSESICHSMKCSEKSCLHRTCLPENRFNHKGHCIGNNDTDSIAAMESIMDLPSNVGFEIVNILQDKMLGKMYGKATVCIITKCSTFVASKKSFQRSKCITKDLNPLGHCPVVKNYITVT